MNKKSVLGSVRLDSDVWEAVRGMGCSLNQYLRSNLLGEMRKAGGVVGTISVEAEKKSATVNLVSEKPMPEVHEMFDKFHGKRLPVEPWKRGPRQKGDKGR